MSAGAPVPVGTQTRCRSCQAPIVWLVTANGGRMPVNAETAERTDHMYEHGRHVSHFATCPNAHEWRKKR